MPVGTSGEVLSLSYGPAEATGVPKDVPVPRGVLENGPLGRPLDKERWRDLVSAVAIGVGSAEHVQ